MNAVGETKATQSCSGQDQAVVSTVVQLLETGDHIAAHVFEFQVWVVMAQLGQAPQRTGADDGPFRKGLESVIGIFGVHHQGIGGVLPLGDATEHQAFRKIRGEVLEGMDRDVSTPHKHLGLQLLGEQTLVTDLGQGDVEDLVSLGRHRFDADGELGMGLLKFGLHPVGLHHGQLAA